MSVLLDTDCYCMFSAAHNAKDSDGEDEKTEKKKTDSKKKSEKTSGISRTDDVHMMLSCAICKCVSVFPQILKCLAISTLPLILHTTSRTVLQSERRSWSARRLVP